MTRAREISQLFESRGSLDLKTHYGAVGDGFTDDTAAIQAALDAKGATHVPEGLYRFTAPLIFREDTSFVGDIYGAGVRLVADYAGSEYPIQVDGANGSGGWVYNLLIENIYVDASQWTGSASHFMNITGVFSSVIRHFTVDTSQAAKKTIRVGMSNWLTLDQIRLYQTVADVVVGLDVDSADGPVNGLFINNPDIELADTGILFTSTDASLNLITCDVVSPYFEACDTYIDWNSARVESKLTILGGHMAQRAGSTGVKIRQSNCTIIGLGTNSSGTYAVDIDGASTHLNCHVIGGNLRAGIRDTNGWLSTNTTGYCSGSKTFDPVSLDDGDRQLTDVTVAGATMGQFAQASFSNDLLGIDLHAHVASADTVRCVFQNETGGTLDLASGTLFVKVT